MKFKTAFATCIVTLFFAVNNFAQSENKIELTNIEFEGNDFFTSSELRNLIVSKESPAWYSKLLNIFSSDDENISYFDSLNIPTDINLIKSIYFSNGFFRTTVSAKYSIEKNNPDKADLTYIINENEPTNFKKIKFSGLNDVPEGYLTNIYSMASVDSTVQYSDAIVEEKRDLTLSYLQDIGYMFAKVEQPIVKIDTVYGNSVTVSMNFNVGKRYKISKVTVEKSGPGKNLVSNNLIKEIVNLKPENFYSYHDLKLAQIRLYRTNLFSSALIAGNTADTTGNYVPIRIVTEVGLLNELSPEILTIYDRTESNNLKLGLGLSWSNKNFLGDARKLTIGSSIAAENITQFIKEGNLATNNIYGYADLRASIEQPFLFGKPINTKLESFYTLEKKKNEWNASIYGAKLNTDFELPPYIYVTGLNSYFTLQRSKYIYKKSYIHGIIIPYLRRKNGPEVTDEMISALVDSLYPRDIESNNTNAVLGVHLVANKTDDFLFPTKGYSLSFLLEDGNSFPYLFSKIGNYNFNQPAYYKFVITSTFYLPLLKNYFDAFGTKFKIGNIHAYHGNISNIPPNQRLTAGGSNSVRGWSANDLPVTQININLLEHPTQSEIENVARNITPGGFFLLEGSFEFRNHLSEKIGSAIFLDYGNVWNNYSEFRFNKLAVAAGFGFRYYSEYAPLRFDLGFKIFDPASSTKFYNRKLFDILEFQIGIGEAF